jgi:phage tail sheath protein FI
VYIEEVASGPQPIAAAPTSVMAILGTTRKGPALTPTRVTSWADYVRTFGPATSRGVTAESVFGFFENGGPAAWVIRVDPSSAASWRAFDVQGRQSFQIAAGSPGTWGNALTIALTPDEAGASGTFYRGVTTGATVAVTNAGNFTLQVASTAGLKPGDDIVLVPIPASGAVAAPVAASVVSLTPTAIELTASGAASMAQGSVVASAAVNAKSSVFIASGKGFKTGDVVVAIAPNGARTDSVVAGVATAGSAVTLTMNGPLGDVPGSAFVLRRADYRAVATVTGTPSAATPPVTNVPMAALTFERPLTAPLAADLAAGLPASARARITMADGRTGTWNVNRFEIVGAAAPPSGPAIVNAPVNAVLLADTGLDITNLSASDVSTAYGFLPTGAIVTYSGAGPTPDIVATRTAGGFSLAPAPVATDTYTDAVFTLEANANHGIAVRCVVPPRVGDRLGLGNAFAPITGVTPAGGDAYVLSFAAATAVSNQAQTRFGLFAVEEAAVVASRFGINVSDGVAAESFAGLSLSDTHPQYYAKDGVINGTSAFVTVSPRAGGAPGVALGSMPFYVAADAMGADAPPTNDDFRDGLTRLEEQQEPAMVVCPDALTISDPLLRADVIGQVVTHCENFRRFAIVDAPDLGDTDLLAWRNTYLSSTYAALFAPHLNIVTIDPDSIARFTTVPPSGFVAGVFARTDQTRGVHKVGANETVRGSTGLTTAYTSRRQDLLNPGGVNLIRAFPGRGIRVWGGRNATDDPTWRYINVRRLFNMIEVSVESATQWVVFEPNTAQTWIRIKVSVENFLDQQWRAGALAGSKPEQAYRVRVGLGQTMTETDIDLGLIITEVAIAPAKPAEFVVFRFSHKRLSE